MTGYIYVKVVLTGLGADPLQQGLMSHCIVWGGHLMAGEEHKLKIKYRSWKYPGSPKTVEGYRKLRSILMYKITILTNSLINIESFK